ncbi:helix-turn-helix transcriptional regulator [Microbacterium rhizomatis]|uniref:LuxR family transcriptional regulator n=1 Tax=Microbacterium rhizomatis TaxID=1631477 RepID=A0A5J5J1Z8_9MICO|nr:LuxR C-terminal-related transcriptional regulator [Microbacterium rhizomatis]KAA9108397.1 LuxR family transcriptional regulator [Microbacterium rhizomatis]
MTTAPSPPPHAVDRPALRRRLDAGLTAPVSFIVAPAGSGKTVLLSQWAASRDDLRFVWVNVDSSDDDPVVLLKKVLGQLILEIPEAAGFQSLGPSSLRAGLLGIFQAAIAASSASVVFVFDDLHNLAGRAVLTEIGALSGRLPPGVHLVLSSRVDLRLDRGRLRLVHAPTELRQAELAFDAETVDEVLERISGASPSTVTTNAVLDRTEGWAAGVQLTAITLRTKDDPEKFALHLAGSDRLIADYLSEEVLRAQSPERREILLRMSVLDRISAELLEAITGVAGAGEMLAELERDSMFLVPLDDASEWFRFHHLFRDLLRYRLRAAHPGEDARMLVLASQWHLGRGDIGEAIECLLQAHEWDPAMSLILARGREVFERGETASMSRWLGMIPAPVRRANLDAEVVHGMMLGLSGQYAMADDVLRRLAASASLPIGHALVVHTYLSALVQFRPDPQASLEAGLRAVELLSQHPHAAVPNLLGLTERGLLETASTGSVARAHFLLGDLDSARRWMTRAASTAGARYSAYRVHMLGSMALLDAWTGNLDRAQALADEALHLASEVRLLGHPAPADAYLALALLSVERGDPLEGAFTLHEGIARATSNQRTQLMWIGHAIDVLAHPGEDVAPPPPVSAPPVVRARLAAAAGRVGGSTRDRVVGRPITAAPHRIPGVPEVVPLSEPLTDRERELLIFLPSRLTNAELAARCFVSVNTIKTHMAHIYRKLDAPNRDAAIAHAQALGLL